MPPEAIDLASRLLQYSPSLRCTAVSASSYSFFCLYVVSTLLSPLCVDVQDSCQVATPRPCCYFLLVTFFLYNGSKWPSLFIFWRKTNLDVTFFFATWDACLRIEIWQFTFLSQLEACAHPFFDELREPNARLPNGRPLPSLFNFKQEVCQLSDSDCFFIWPFRKTKCKHSNIRWTMFLVGQFLWCSCYFIAILLSNYLVCNWPR